jgi:hypothetical protein
VKQQQVERVEAKRMQRTTCRDMHCNTIQRRRRPSGAAARFEQPNHGSRQTNNGIEEVHRSLVSLQTGWNAKGQLPSKIFQISVHDVATSR